VDLNQNRLDALEIKTFPYRVTYTKFSTLHTRSLFTASAMLFHYSLVCDKPIASSKAGSQQSAI